jgi:hypothetical protein
MLYDMGLSPLGFALFFRAINIDLVSIDIDIYDVGYTGEGFIFLWNAEKLLTRLTHGLLC